jgi:hypothetical protein
LSKLDTAANAGGLNSGDIMAHEVMDAYLSFAFEKDDADALAAHSYPGLMRQENFKSAIDRNNQLIMGSLWDQRISDGRGTMHIVTSFITPIPVQSLIGQTKAQQQAIGFAAGARVEGVTFVPKP